MKIQQIHEVCRQRRQYVYPLDFFIRIRHGIYFDRRWNSMGKFERFEKRSTYIMRGYNHGGYIRWSLREKLRKKSMWEQLYKKKGTYGIK